MTGTSLGRDIADAHALKEDLRALRRDAEDQRNDWRVLYAVDFAEIHSYVIPEDEDRLSIFRDDDEMIARTVHDNALQRILFDTPPVLLPPYLLELDNFLNRFDPKVFAKVAAAATRLVIDAKRLAALPEFAAARNAVEQFRASENSEGALEELRTFIEHNAELLAAMKTLDAMSPAQRLKKLLGSGFVDFEEEIGSAVLPDEEVYVRWRSALDRIRKKRDPASNKLDALAVAFLKSANEQLASRKIKLRLVTRSGFMHKLMRHEVDAGHWDDPPLRNPRCFGAFVDDWKSPGAFDALTSLLTSVEAFLDSAAGVSSASIKAAGDDPVTQHLERLKGDWRTAFDLGIIARQSKTPTVTPAEVREFVDLMTVVNKSQRLRRVLADLSREMYGEIPKTYQLLGLLVHGRDAAMRKVFEEYVSNIEPTREAETVVLSSTQDNVPYRLEFYSAELRNWGALFAGKALDWAAIANFFMDALASEAGDYEVLLALAYLLCATGNWAATEKYCRLALAEPDAQEKPSEGLFLLAFALRRQTPADLARYEEALTAIDQAIKAKLGGSRDPIDPRYLKEKATLILLWWRRYRGYPGRPGESAFRPPAISESFALQMYEEALAHPGADDDLKAQIYNNLTMVMLNRGDATSLDSARDYLHRLKQLRPIDGDVWRASALILDTIIWGGWRLGECTSQDELARQVEKLEHAAKSRGISAEERAQIRDHIREMATGLPESRA